MRLLARLIHYFIYVSESVQMYVSMHTFDHQQISHLKHLIQALKTLWKSLQLE